VTAAARQDGARKDGARKNGARKNGARKDGSRSHRSTSSRKPDPVPAADPSRAAVRAEIVRAARWYGVDPQLALAVSWQEAGWQMHHVSSAGAVGAMQVLPSTAEWMSMYAGRRLDVRNTRDNIAAGVLLLDVLRTMTSSREHQIGAYYQGPGAVQSYGLYAETRAYVANVQAIKRALERGWSPA
jgi:soluble lytic murein transglycosylase-like protein